MLSKMVLFSMPMFTARFTYSGNRAAEVEVEKNFSIQSLFLPLTLMSNRLSCRW